MTKRHRAPAAAGRALGRLVSPETREWLEAIRAEGPEVPAGLERFAWRAGSLRVITREAFVRRRLGVAALFGLAASAVIWAVWQGAPATVARSLYRADVFAVMLEAVGVVLVGRLLFGRVSSSWTAKLFRMGAFLALLVLIATREAVRLFSFELPRGALARLLHGLIDPTRGKTAALEPVLFICVGLFATAFLWMTSRRSRVAPGSLAVGLGGGLVLGLVMYSIAPLGLSKDATNPFLPGHDIDPLLVLAWALVLIAPLVAAAVARHRHETSSASPPSRGDLARQGVAAILGTYLVGALVAMVLGTVTTALMIKSAWLRSWLYHGPHLLFGVGGLKSVVHGNPAAIAYAHAITGADDQGGLVFVCLGFLVLAGMETLMVALTVPVAAPRSPGEPPPPDDGGPQGPPPLPDPSGGQQLPEVVGSGHAPVLLFRLEELDPGQDDSRVLVSVPD